MSVVLPSAVGVLGLLFGRLLQPLLLALVEHLDQRLHRHGGEYAIHVHRQFDLPVGFRGEGVVALLVDVELGPFGLAPLHHTARVPLAVVVAVLDQAELDLARRNIVELHRAAPYAGALLKQRTAAVEQLDDVGRSVVARGEVDLHHGELLGIERGIIAADGVVRETGHVGDGTLRDVELVFGGLFPGCLQIPAAQVGRVPPETGCDALRRPVCLLQNQRDGGGVEPHERIVEIDGDMLFGVDLARGDLVGEGVLLLGGDILLARRFGLFTGPLLLLALLLLLLGFDEAPRELQLFGHLLQLIDRVVLEVGDPAADGVGQFGGGRLNQRATVSRPTVCGS